MRGQIRQLVHSRFKFLHNLFQNGSEEEQARAALEGVHKDHVNCAVTKQDEP